MARRTPKTAFDINRLGAAIGAGIVQAQSQAQSQRYKSFGGQFPGYPGLDVFKDVGIDAVGQNNIYGRYSIFDPCQMGDIFGLQVETHGLINWLGWRPNSYYSRRVAFIDWFGPEGTVAGEPTTGAGSPCDDPLGVEYGKCGYQLCHTSWYHRRGDALTPHDLAQDRCETTPRYRINGQLITDDFEWQANLIEGVLAQSIRRDLIHGSHDNDYEMHGLENLIITGYRDPDTGIECPRVDADLIDWAHDDLDGEVNGLGNFFDYLDELVTEKEWRASFRTGGIAQNDMILLTSRFMATCLLDAYSCYTICGKTDETDITEQALRASLRQYRQSLNAGPLYDGKSAVGYIQLKSGRRLPIIVEDSLDITNVGADHFCSDIYILTRRVGSQEVLYGEYLDLRKWENAIKKHDPKYRVRTDAAGRFAIRSQEDNWCTYLMMGTSPEIYIAAPWAQARIEHVCCVRRRQPLSGDPFQPDYLPGGAPLYGREAIGALCADPGSSEGSDPPQPVR